MQWAAAEAEKRRGTGLRIMHAFPLPQLGQPIQHDVDDLLRNEASALLDRIAESVRRDHPHLDVTIDLIQNSPANALQDESVGAALTVVGAKESGRLVGGGTRLGRVSGCHGESRSRSPWFTPITRRRQLVRLPSESTGSAGSSAAVEFRLRRSRGAEHRTLGRALLARTQMMEGEGPRTIRRFTIRLEIEKAETALLSEARPPARAIPTRMSSSLRVVRRGRAATVLLEHSRSACIVVVGRRRRGELQSLIMGSTSRLLIAHSPCPVVIARSRDTDRR